MENKQEKNERRSFLENVVNAGLRMRFGGNISLRLLNGNSTFVRLPQEKVLVDLDHGTSTAILHPTFTSSFPKDADDMEKFLTSSVGFLVERPQE